MSPSNCSRSLANMQKALTETRNSLGKVTKPYHYVNEVRLLGYALHSGFKSGLELKDLTRDQMRLLRRMICLNTQLIRAHVDYADRKQSCRQLVLDQEAKSRT